MMEINKSLDNLHHCILKSLFLTLLLLLIAIESQSEAAVENHHHSNNNPKLSSKKITNESIAEEFLARVNLRATQLCKTNKLNQWNYNTNLNSTSARLNATSSSLVFWKFWKNMSDIVTKYDSSGFINLDNKRLLHLISTHGHIVTNDTQMKKFTETKQAMESIFSKAKVCSYKDGTKCNLTLEPDLTLEMTNLQDPEALKYYWLAFRNATGRRMRKNYTDMSNIIYQAIRQGGHYKTVMAAETRLYETPNLKSEIDSLWSQVEPFYQQLHAYVRYKLHQHFNNDSIVSLTEPIPAHLLGNMWAQSWTNIFDLIVPFPNKPSIDITPKLIEQQLSPIQMVRMAEDFFQSIGFPKLPQEFWSGSIFEKPPVESGQEIVCHASAWDMCDGVNYRIKQCTKITFDDFITLHHEMGHIYYQLQYKHQPLLFRDGANPGFHEAIGDLISLSVQTPTHLKTIGLLDVGEEDENANDDLEADINYLLAMALEHVAFLPFGYLVDQWRWAVFQKEILPDDYNCEWWKLRVNIQGVQPPVTRTEADFDPGAKFHIASNTGYIRYFISSIIQFQFHQSLCTIAKKYDAKDSSAGSPLHKCDIYGSKEAGQRLMKMLSMGYSKPWQDAMEVMTGKRSMDANAILEYFHPLIKWLETENKRLNLTIGWVQKKPACIKTSYGEKQQQSSSDDDETTRNNVNDAGCSIFKGKFFESNNIISLILISLLLIYSTFYSTN